MAQKKATNNTNSRTRTVTRKGTAPYQKNASTENYTGRISLAFIFLFLACFTAVSYFVEEGAFIVAIREFMSGLLGYGYWACAICFLWVSMILFKGSNRAAMRVVSVLLIPVLFSAFIDVISYTAPSSEFNLGIEVNRLFEDGQTFRCGGVISGLIVIGMVSLLSRLGTGIVIFILIIICVGLAVSEPDSWFTPQQPQKKSKTAQKSQPRVARFNPETLIRMNDDNPDEIFFPGRNSAEENPPSFGAAVSKPKSEKKSKRVFADIPLMEDEGIKSAVPGNETDPEELSVAVKNPTAAKQRKNSSAASEKETAQTQYTGKASGKVSVLSEKTTQKTAEEVSLPSSGRNTNHISDFAFEESGHIQPESEFHFDDNDVTGITMEKSSSPVSTRKAASTKADMKQPEKITKKDVEKEAKKVAAAISKDKDEVIYTYPDTALLKCSKPAGADSRDEILANKERLENALHSFGIFSSVVNITHGPTVTRYDIELEQGVKLTKVTNLANDIALSLGVQNVRIAPIPDEISTVGIEVPNKIVNTVGLREIIESDNFVTAKSRLTFAIGKDIAGNAICGNISKLPHLLIAGTTGSGKSVCMNSLIISLLYKARPDEVKFIMIDPKMVELGIYNSIPHLYVPVVTDPKKAAGALQWAVVEMLKRYRLFSEAGVRDLETYNKFCINNGEEPLPQMVIVIDELADLMMAASKEVEESICRIAQMGRASGQHLVIATQRPSADVITGLMKANIPSRIAFAVSSTLESRIILDQGGADKLIGHGDMLYAPIGCGKPLRVQGAFVSDEEREDIINFISKHSDTPSVENDELKEFMDKALEGKKGDDPSSSGSSKNDNSIAGEYDEMLPQAAEVVLEMKQCSVSMLQRRLKLGYSRAARIVDQMEELGIVGPYEGAKPRSVPIDRDAWHEIQVSLGIASSDDYALAAEMSSPNPYEA